MRLIDADTLVARCGDYYVEEGPEDGFIGTLKTLIDMQHTISEWVSVEDRLPEEHESMFYKLLGTPKWSNLMWKQESEKVLVYVSFPDGTGVVTTGCLHNSDWVTTVSKALPQTVTHWMPLPKAPEVKQDG